MSGEVDRLIMNIEKGRLDVKIKAVRRLAELKSKRAVKPLIKLLEQSLGDYQKRFLIYSTIESLGKIGSKKAGNMLLKAMDSRLFFIKEAAAEALAEVRPDEITVAEFKKVIYSEEPLEVKKSAIKGLGRITKNKADAVSPLMDIYYKEADLNIREYVVRALSSLATTSSVEFLIHALNNTNPEIRSCAALALGDTGNRIACLPLKQLLTDKVDKVRKSAAKALGLLDYLPK